jgi:hypothetical protein
MSKKVSADDAMKQMFIKIAGFRMDQIDRYLNSRLTMEVAGTRRRHLRKVLREEKFQVLHDVLHDKQKLTELCEILQLMCEAQKRVSESMSQERERKWSLNRERIERNRREEARRVAKQKMVAAHPDKGGTCEEFIKARAAYEALR